MDQLCCARGWSLDVERGPECLFVRPRRNSDELAATRSLAEQIWSLLEQNFTYRVVLELGDIEQLDSLLIEQVLWLDKQIRDHGGMLRLCGLSPENRQLFVEAGLEGHVAHYCDREQAVMGSARPLQPR
jgi:anti-anti-sigma regulatory factor